MNKKNIKTKYVIIFSVLTPLAIIAGLYQDVVRPIFSDSTELQEKQKIGIGEDNKLRGIDKVFIQPPESSSSDIEIRYEFENSELESIWSNLNKEDILSSYNKVKMLNKDTFYSVGESKSENNYKVISKRNALHNIAVTLNNIYKDRDEAKNIFTSGEIIWAKYNPALYRIEIHFKVK